MHAAELLSFPSEPVAAADAVAAETFDEAFWPLFLTAFRAAYRILRDTAAAEDVAADVLGRLHVRWDRLGRAGHRDAWVVRVATNRALDVVKRGAPPAAAPRVAAFEDELTSRLTVTAAVRALSRRQREAVALRYFVGLPEREVALVLGIGEGSVRRHLDRALRRLRTDLQGEER